MVEVRTYSIDELVELTGFSQRNIAYYIQQGLLPKIGRRGRNTRYPQLFVDRLRFIQRVRDLQDSGRLGSVTLPRIARVIWYLVERSGEGGELPELDDRDLQRIFEDDSIPDERELGLGDAGELVTVGFGKSGPYVQTAQETASIDAEEFSSITLEEALERIYESIREQERQIIKKFEEDEIQVREGRTGPYVELHGEKANVPDDIDPTRITLEQCWDLLERRHDKPQTGSASKRRDNLASRVHGSVSLRSESMRSLSRSQMGSATSADSSAGRKKLIDRFRRKRKPPEDLGSDASPVPVVEPDGNAQLYVADEYETFGSVEDSFSSEAALNLDQGDSIAEADFHMAYGLYDQAADLIVGELEAEPADRGLMFKLCEIYFACGNRDAFVDAAKRLKDAVGESDSADWDKVVIMGQQIASNQDIFASARVADMTPAVDLLFEEVKSENGEHDLMLSERRAVIDDEMASGVTSEPLLPQIDLDGFEVDMDTVRTVDVQLITRHRVLPIARRGDRILLAITRKTPERAIDDIKFATSLAVEPVVVSEDQLEERIGEVIESVDASFASMADDDFDLECLSLEDDSAAWELPEGEPGHSFHEIGAEPVAAAKLASLDSSYDLNSAEDGEEEGPLMHALQARLLADKIERNVIESNKKQGRQTEYWTRVPITEQIELSVKGIAPNRADLVESLAERIRLLLGLETDRDVSDQGDE